MPGCLRASRALHVDGVGVATTSAGLTRPPRLRPGSRVAAVTLSWGGPGTFPARYEAGVRQLEDEFGVEVVELPSTRAPAAELASDPQRRADDLHAAFADDTIDAVVSTIGGDDSIRLLPLLDLDLLASHPKPFVGYSDPTTIHMALRRAGMVSFYGPAIMSGFGENAGLHEYLVEGVRRMLVDPVAPLAWPENRDGWTVELLDWRDPTLQERPRALRSSTGWRWHGGERRSGPTVAASLEALDFLRGSVWWPDLTGVVLLLETSEEAPPPVVVTRFLRSLELTGELARLAGIVLGRPGGADLDPDAHAAYDEALLGVVRDEAGLDELAVVTGVDMGHTDPMWTVPQGVELELDPDAGRLTFLEVGVA